MKKLFIALFSVLLLISCTNKRASYGSKNADVEEAVTTTSRAMASESTGNSELTLESYERKIIKTGHISLEVQDLNETLKKVTDWTTKNNGYISNSETTKYGVEITIRIPNSGFDKTIEEMQTIGKVESRSINAEDISEQYYDLQSRLETRKILRDKLNGYLKSAKDTKDMLAIEAQINSVQTEIESMEGKLRRLSSQIDYSTLHIHAHLPPQKNEDGFIYPDMSYDFAEFWGNVLSFLAGLLLVLMYIIVFGLPLILIIALFYWLSFGKIGLLRKLFEKIKADK